MFFYFPKHVNLMQWLDKVYQIFHTTAAVLPHTHYNKHALHTTLQLHPRGNSLVTLTHSTLISLSLYYLVLHYIFINRG